MKNIFLSTIVGFLLLVGLSSAFAGSIEEQLKLIELAKNSQANAAYRALEVLRRQEVTSEEVQVGLVDLLGYWKGSNYDSGNMSVRALAQEILTKNHPKHYHVQMRMAELAASSQANAAYRALAVLKTQNIPYNEARLGIIDLLAYWKNSNYDNGNMSVRTLAQEILSVDRNSPLTKNQMIRLVELAAESQANAAYRALGVLKLQTIPYESVQLKLVGMLDYWKGSNYDKDNMAVRSLAEEILKANSDFYSQRVQLALVDLALESLANTAYRALAVLRGQQVIHEDVRLKLVELLSYWKGRNYDRDNMSVRALAQEILNSKRFVLKNDPILVGINRTIVVEEVIAVTEGQPLAPEEKQAIDWISELLKEAQRSGQPVKESIIEDLVEYAKSVSKRAGEMAWKIAKEARGNQCNGLLGEL